MTQELTRNDIAAFTLFKKMMTRLQEHREEHLTRVALAQQAYSAFTQLNGLVNSHTYSPITSQQLMNSQIALHQHMHSLSSPGHSHNLGATMASWTPYMTASEYEVFDAYMRGEDVVLHVLADQRD